MKLPEVGLKMVREVIWKRTRKGEDKEGEGQENGAIDAVPVDENLFTGEDLDELEEELNTLDLEE